MCVEFGVDVMCAFSGSVLMCGENGNVWNLHEFGQPMETSSTLFFRSTSTLLHGVFLQSIGVLLLVFLSFSIYIYISTIDPHVQHQLIIDGIHYTNIIDWRNALNRSIDRVVFWCVLLSLACVCVCCDLFADSFIRINSSLLRRIINFLLLLPSFTCILFVWILQTPFESIIIALYRVQVFIVGWCVAVFRELKHL